VPLWGSTQTTASLGQCSCACCSVRNAVRTIGEWLHAVEDSANAIARSPKLKPRVNRLHEAHRCVFELAVGISQTAISAAHHNGAASTLRSVAPVPAIRVGNERRINRGQDSASASAMSTLAATSPTGRKTDRSEPVARVYQYSLFSTVLYGRNLPLSVSLTRSPFGSGWRSVVP
jgi:hypothetical protein